MLPPTYTETFDDGPGGWIGWESNAAGAKPLAIERGAAVSRSPWWIDYNHAPPGGGYLHLLFALHTRHHADTPRQYLELGGRNRFVEGRYPTDLTHAAFTARLRGELSMRGADLRLLVQSRVDGRAVNYILTGQRLLVGRQWDEQTLRFEPDAAQWQCLGSRHDRSATYGEAPIGRALRDVNLDVILVLFPLTVAPLAPASVAEPHRLRAGEDYVADPRLLPEGFVELDEVRIEFAR
jgi:hypothetical protein